MIERGGTERDDDFAGGGSRCRHLDHCQLMDCGSWSARMVKE